MLDEYCFYNMFVSSAARQTNTNKSSLKSVDEVKYQNMEVEDIMQTIGTNNPDLKITTELSE